MKLEGRVAVITGAGGGLGGAAARLFAAEGAHVVCQDLAADKAEATVASIAGAGGPEAVAHACDVTDSAAIDAMFKDVDDRWGRVDVLVNNAGVDRTPGDGQDVPDETPVIMKMTDDAWQRMLDIHLNGAFYSTRAAAHRMVPAGSGSIISVSSIAGLAGIGIAHYSTAKGGLLGFTRQLARDLGPFGIRANAVCPGVIDTPMTAKIDKAMIDPLLMATPLGRIGHADDIANAMLYLASDDSSFVTGQWLSPNGGIFIG